MLMFAEAGGAQAAIFFLVIKGAEADAGENSFFKKWEGRIFTHLTISFVSLRLSWIPAQDFYVKMQAAGT